MAIELVKVVQTSLACPTQFDAWDREGQYYYLRYRHGMVQVRKFASPEDMTPPSAENLVCEFAGGHPLDGSIGLVEFAERAGLRIADDAETQDWGHYLVSAMAEAFRGVNPEDPEDLLVDL